jgi:transcription elongation GreA/GreB family factor
MNYKLVAQSESIFQGYISIDSPHGAGIIRQE